jgi:hypothetical protein
VFGTEIRKDGSFVAFVVQQVGVWIASVIWALITIEFPRWLSQFGPVANILEAATIITLAFGPAFLCARWVRATHPDFAFSGRWIWILPCVLLIASLLQSLRRPALLLRGFSAVLYPPPDGEQWWAVLLFTFPLLGCVGYSFGARIGDGGDLAGSNTTRCRD